mmetsp:Transcript_55253/g.177108  ORF Transcript_55253/g.177108 Transcript_55253/m.177108 type:complete len:229 (+) Transcript_55253:78-764(+)
MHQWQACQKALGLICAHRGANGKPRRLPCKAAQATTLAVSLVPEGLQRCPEVPACCPASPPPKEPRSQDLELGVRPAGLRLVLVEELAQGRHVLRVPLVHLSRRGLGRLGQLQRLAHVGQQLASSPREDRKPWQATEDDRRNTPLVEPEPELQEAANSVVRVRLAEGVHWMEPIAMAEAVLHETFALGESHPVTGVSEDCRLLVGARYHADRLACLHESLHGAPAVVP